MAVPDLSQTVANHSNFTFAGSAVVPISSATELDAVELFPPDGSGAPVGGVWTFRAVVQELGTVTILAAKSNMGDVDLIEPARPLSQYNAITGYTAITPVKTDGRARAYYTVSSTT